MRIIFVQPTIITRFGLLEEFGYSSSVVANSKALGIVTNVPDADDFGDNTRFMEGVLIELLRNKCKGKDETVLEFQRNANYFSFVVYVYSNAVNDVENLTKNTDLRIHFTGFNIETQYWLVAGTVAKDDFRYVINALKDLKIHVGNLDHIS